MWVWTFLTTSYEVWKKIPYFHKKDRVNLGLYTLSSTKRKKTYIYATGNFQDGQRTFFLREKRIFLLNSILPIMLEQHKPPFIGNKGIGPIYVFQMSEWAATGVLLGFARCAFHPI